MAPKNHTPRESFSFRTTAVFSLAKYLLFLFIFIALLAFVALILIYPLWFLATEHKTLYTIGMGICILILIALFFFFRLRAAVYDSRIDEFYKKLFQWVVVLLLFSVQLLFTLINVFWLELIKTRGQVDIACIGVMSGAVIIELLSLILLFGAHGRKLISPAGTVFIAIIYIISPLYWEAVYLFRSFFLPAITLFLIIFGFFFFTKLTKIKRGKKKPGNESHTV
jgi:hypothetical protein